METYIRRHYTPLHMKRKWMRALGVYNYSGSFVPLPAMSFVSFSIPR
jgi:hypothetical protein